MNDIVPKVEICPVCRSVSMIYSSEQVINDGPEYGMKVAFGCDRCGVYFVNYGIDEDDALVNAVNSWNRYTRRNRMPSYNELFNADKMTF